MTNQPINPLNLEHASFTLPIGPDGWFVDPGPGNYNWLHEQHVRQWMVRFAQYADLLGGGNTRLYDRTGRYLCGGYQNVVADSCNKYQPGQENYEVGTCTVFGHDRAISGPRGSCDYWENFAGKIATAMEIIAQEALDAEPWACPNSALKRDVVYVEDPLGEGFGCFPRCPHGNLALGPDPQGRMHFCRFFGVHVQDTECCRFNAHAPVITFVNDKAQIPNASSGLMSID